MPAILVVDDDRSVVRTVRSAFQNTNIAVFSGESVGESLRTIGERHPDVLLLDIMLPDQSGLAGFERIQKLDPKLPVIFVTASGTSHTAIEAVKRGAFDFLVKPLDVAKVRELVDQALKIRHFTHDPVRISAASAQGTEQDATKADLLVGRCPAMQEVYKAIGRVAQQNVHVLVRGESGTGKELVARAIWQHGPRAGRPFLAVNCAAIPETLLESELFGHERGSFTGATSRRVGKFEQGHGGTLFLDEVGDMTPLMQSKVLRALQDRRFERVGGNETIEADVWIVAATNRDLEAMVAAGQFRADLYYRLNGFPIVLPPLRERGTDIPLLVEHFLTPFNAELNKSLSEVSPEAMELLTRYPWPGNVRELQSTLKQAILQATGPLLLPEFLPAPVREWTASPAPAAGEAEKRQTPLLWTFIDEQIERGSQSLYTDAIAMLERVLLTNVLRHVRGNKSRAAKILGITRGCLRNKILEHGIHINPSVKLKTLDAAESEADSLLPTG
jgi:two-component system nitrogen regulation response regulator GlnG